MSQLEKLFSFLSENSTYARNFLEKSHLRSLRNLSILPPETADALVSGMVSAMPMTVAEKMKAMFLIHSWRLLCLHNDIHWRTNVRMDGGEYISARDFMIPLIKDEYSGHYDCDGNLTEAGYIARSHAYKAGAC